IAAYAIGAATFLDGVLPVARLGGTVATAIELIAVFTAINCLSVRTGGRVESVLTVLKVAMIGGLAGGVLFSHGGGWHHLSEHAAGGDGGFPGWNAFGLA